MHSGKAVEGNLKTDPNIETKVDQSYINDVDWVRTQANRVCEADDLADKQQRIAAVKRKVRHDTNVTDCTLAIGDVVYIRVCTWRGKIQDICSPIVHVVICVPYVGSNVYVVRPATGGPNETLNRASLLHARLPETEVDDYAEQEVLRVQEIAQLRIRRASSKRCQHWTNVPLGGGDVLDDVIIPRRSTRTNTGVPPDRLCFKKWV